MDENQILQDLYDFNPHWDGCIPSEEKLFHRRQFTSLVKLIQLPQVVAVHGLRRTGKTTLLLQIIADLLRNKNVLPRRICRYQFEEKLISPKSEDMESIIRLYIRNILKEGIHTSQAIYFFFDELQLVEGWQGIIKKYYDLNKNLKFFISGSASLFIKTGTKESLAGRAFEEKVSPLSFKEYLSINRDHQMDFWNLDFDLENNLDDFIQSNQAIYAKDRDIAPFLFETFLTRGGFPEIAAWEDPHLSYRYIQESIISKLIEIDLPKLYGFRKTDELGILLSVLAKETGNLLEYENLSREIGIAQNTLKEYLHAFIDSSLADLVYNQTQKHRRAKRQLKKGYISSPNITCAIHRLTQGSLVNNPVLGHLVETEIVNRLKETFRDIAFWNKRGKEIDIIISRQNQVIPIEVKYKNRLQREDWKHLSEFLVLQESPFGIVITKNEFTQSIENGKKIYFIPAWFV